MKDLSGEHLIEKILSGERNFAGIRIEKAFDFSGSGRYAELQAYLKEQDLPSSPFCFDGAEFLQMQAREWKIPFSTFRGAKLQEIDLSVADLENADFTDADLTRANLGRAVMIAATFHNAKAEGANFEEVNLDGADFWKANLRNANFFKANLRDAILAECNLYQTDFSKSNMTKTNLFGASTVETNFKAALLTDANLKGVKDFDKARNLSRARFHLSRMGKEEYAVALKAIQKRFFVEI